MLLPDIIIETLNAIQMQSEMLVPDIIIETLNAMQMQS
jgi:hypothetical protein